MRVLHAYAGNLFGGIEKLLLILAEHGHLCPGFEQEFVLCFDGKLAEGLRKLGATVHLTPPVRLRNPLSIFRARRAMSKLLSTRSYDAVLIHASWPHAVFAKTVRQHKKPLVYFAHDAMRPEIKLTFMERLAQRWPPDLILSNSRYTANTLHRLFPNSPTEIYYGPVVPPDVSDRQNIRRRLRSELHTGEDESVILLASRLEEWKGHGLLIDALGQMKNRAGWRAWITSNVQRPHEADYLKQLTEQCARLGISDRVMFLGDRPDAADLMLAADIHCQPNKAPEPFGRVFVEAMYAGMTVITTDMGGGAEVIREGEQLWGILVPADDPKALAHALTNALSDPELRRRSAQEGPDRAASLCKPVNSIQRLAQLVSKATTPAR